MDPLKSQLEALSKLQPGGGLRPAEIRLHAAVSGELRLRCVARTEWRPATLELIAG